MKLGCSFSYRQAEVLGLDPDLCFDQILSLPLQYIRLACHWSDMEIEPQKYDFSRIISQIKKVEKADKKAIITVGMKAPRWPEFYIPEWYSQDPNDPETQKNALKFTKKCVEQLKQFACISHWQLENEPLDPSGPDNQVINTSYLQDAADLMRQLDSRPVLLTAWGNDVVERQTLKKLEPICDTLGIDLYYQQFIRKILGKNIYTGPHQTEQQLDAILQTSAKNIWVTELQAEPWESSMEAFQAENPQSFSLNKLEKWFESVQKLPIEGVLLWGVEYWLWRDKHLDTTFLKETEHFLIKVK